MGSEVHSLLDLATSISDGTAVDWPAAEARVADERTRRSLRELRLLAALADAHRTISFEDESTAPTGSGRIVGRIAPQEAATTWGELELREQIGREWYGEVYRGFDPKLERDVAVKLLHPDRSRGELTARILAEGRSLARVQHPNVVAIYGADERDGRPGLWMEFVRGCTLEETLRAGHSFDADEAALVGRQLCQALTAVHTAGLVHRDVKPQNVMREQGGRVVLMDFGAGQTHLPGVVPAAGAGTPLYTAPEVLNGEAATPQSDIYSARRTALSPRDGQLSRASGQPGRCARCARRRTGAAVARGAARSAVVVRHRGRSRPGPRRRRTLRDSRRARAGPGAAA